MNRKGGGRSIYSIKLTIYKLDISNKEVLHNNMNERKLAKAVLARQSMSVDRMITVLLSDGVVECNSPKNRHRLYRRLKESGLKYRSEVIGHTNGMHAVDYWSTNCWTPSKLAKWILNKRLTKERVMESYEVTNQQYKSRQYNFADIEAIFDAKDKQTIVTIITNAYDNLDLTCNKIHPLNNHLYIYKTIARITLVK